MFSIRKSVYEIWRENKNQLTRSILSETDNILLQVIMVILEMYNADNLGDKTNKLKTY